MGPVIVSIKMIESGGIKSMKTQEFNQECKLSMKDPIRKAVFLSGIWKTKEDIERITNDFKNKNTPVHL